VLQSFVVVYIHVYKALWTCALHRIMKIQNFMQRLMKLQSFVVVCSALDIEATKLRVYNDAAELRAQNLTCVRTHKCAQTYICTHRMCVQTHKYCMHVCAHTHMCTNICMHTRTHTHRIEVVSLLVLFRSLSACPWPHGIDRTDRYPAVAGECERRCEMCA